MNKSPNIAELSKALCAAQAEIGPVPFNAQNPFLKNRFADLGAVISTSKPVMAKHGLSIVQTPVSNDRGDIGITTLLLHSSGEWLEETIFLQPEIEKGKSTAQVAGSIITYLRRYSWAAVMGLHAEEDADGEPGRGGKPEAKPEPKPTVKKAGRPLSSEHLRAFIAKRISEQGAALCTQADRQVLAAQLDAILGDKTKRYELCTWLVGQASTQKMTQPTVKVLLAWLEARGFDDTPPDYVRQEAVMAHSSALIAAGQNTMIDPATGREIGAE